MHTRLDLVARSLSVSLGVVTLIGVGVLFAWEIVPGHFPHRAHNFLAALPLAMIAMAFLVYQPVRRPPPRELVQAIVVAFAFFFWAANQLWPGLPQATLFNDIAIALFVFDVFLAITSRRPI
jgi:hypothetical protein